MYGFKFFVPVVAVLVTIFSTDTEVTAAPAPEPHPCLWMLDYGHGHVGHAEPTTTTPTTAKPDLVENLAKLKNKNTNQMEKLVTDWIMWGPSSETQKPRSRNPLERMISGYLKFLASILNKF